MFLSLITYIGFPVIAASEIIEVESHVTKICDASDNDFV